MRSGLLLVTGASSFLLAACVGGPEEGELVALHEVLVHLRGEGLETARSLTIGFEDGAFVMSDREGNLSYAGLERDEAECLAILSLLGVPTSRYTLTAREPGTLWVTNAAGQVWLLELEAPGRPRRVMSQTIPDAPRAILEARHGDTVQLRLWRGASEPQLWTTTWKPRLAP